MTFALDANGILAVTAQDTVTGAKAGAEIKAKDGRLSADEIDKMVQDAEKHRAQDDELADKVRSLATPFRAWPLLFSVSRDSSRSGCGPAVLVDLKTLTRSCFVRGVLCC